MDNFVENMKGVFERNKKHQENPLLVPESVYEKAVQIARENNISIRIESVKGRWKKED